MTASCLDPTLISKSVAGTGVNVILLMQALTPLCPEPSPRVEIAANHIVTVVIGYVCGFLPWGFIALFDFISAKWKTVRKTRLLGYLHLGASVVPMVFVIAYAVLQALSGDYKEMMTAVIALALTLHHMLRTIWGLVQLRQYVTWCENTLQCIKATQPTFWLHVWNCSEEEGDDESIDLNEALMVNEEIVDNEFTGRDVSVSYSFSERTMKVSNPEVSTIRWAAAFLCSLGHKWKSSRREPIPSYINDETVVPKELSRFMTGSLFYIDESQRGSPPVSFEHLSKTLFEKGSNCGAFGSNISARLLFGINVFESFQFEFDNIIGSYPPCNETDRSSSIEQNRIDARLELVEFILAARMLGPQKLQTVSSQSGQRRAAFHCHQQFEDAFDFVQHQLSIEEPIRIHNVHWLWKLVMVPCLSEESIAFTLQTSVQIDNCIAIRVGEFIGENEDLQIMLEEHVGFLDSSNRLLQSLGFSTKSQYMLGISLDLIRKYLAEWVLRSGDLVDAACWCPRISKDSISFVLSEFLTDEVKKDYVFDYYKEFVLAECQAAVRKNIIICSSEKIQLPRTKDIIALFILSYPAIHIKRQESTQHITGNSNKTVEFTIQPMAVPQNIHLSLKMDTSSGAASLKIVVENEDMEFDWEKWINTAMQLMKSYNKIAKTEIERHGKSKFDGPLDLIKNVDLSRPMCRLNHVDQDDVLSSLPGPLQVWTAWPMFDVRFCLFELGQWMNACDPLPDGWYEADTEYRRRRNNAFETLAKIADWVRT